MKGSFWKRRWIHIRRFKTYGGTGGTAPALFEHDRWMCGEGLGAGRGTHGPKQQQNTVWWFNEFLLLWGLHCSFLPESTGCHHWGQEETLVWNKGCADITYLHTTIRRQAEQEVSGRQQVYNTGMDTSAESIAANVLCHMCGDLKNWIWKEKKMTWCNSGLTGTLTNGWMRRSNKHLWRFHFYTHGTNQSWKEISVRLT